VSEVAAARIFPEADSKPTQNWLTKIAPGVFYYADKEGRGKSTHPLSDCWFATAGEEWFCVTSAEE